VPVRRNKTKRFPAPKALNEYARKRHFDRTPEPQVSGDGSDGWEFVVQKHAARNLHYDLRLELDGVLKSWAITRGPSLTVGEKRLAVHTEDHPIECLMCGWPPACQDFFACGLVACGHVSGL
jgi:hypothetical protein